MSTKRLSLRRADACAVCGVELVVGTVAWWSSELRTVSCQSCHDASAKPLPVDNISAATALEPLSLEAPDVRTGEAGRSALEEYQRRHEKREALIDAKYGRFASVVKFLTDDPQSITAWKKGSIGEQKLAKNVQENLGDRVILLNDRKVPRTRGNIDHLIIASSGVWVVDAKNYSGLVQQRDVGGFFKVDMRLYVGGRDRSRVLEGLDWQVRSVTTALGDPEVQVSSAVCFTDAEWGWFAKPFTMRGVFVSGPNGLSRKIAETGNLSKEAIHEIARRLSEALPPKE
ncbi:MAG TPA: nuclease-related domain-containing protein [Acidimicrobiales bacterium]